MRLLASATVVTIALAGFVVATPASAATYSLPTAPGASAATLQSSYVATAVTGPDDRLLVAGDNSWTHSLSGTVDSYPALTPVGGLPDAPVTSITTDGNMTVVAVAGALYGVGSTFGHGVFGSTVPDSVTSFVELPPLPSGVTTTKIALAFSCLIAAGSDGLLYRIGDGDGNGGVCPLASGQSATEFSVLPGSRTNQKILDLSVGGNGSSSNHLVVTYGDGQLWGIGENGHGQLTGSTPSLTTLSHLPELPGGAKPAAVAIGGDSTVVLDRDGALWGVGDNSSTSLTGTASGYTSWHAFSWLSGTTPQEFVRVTAGGGDTLALGADGVLYGVGYGSTLPRHGYEALGRVAMPEGMPTPVDLNASTSFFLVRTADGDVWGAGDNIDGSLAGDQSSYIEWHLLEGMPIAERAQPVITGTAHVGWTLTVSEGAWSHSGTITYQWSRDGAPIAGATTRTYTPIEAEVGAALAAQITITSPSHITASATAEPVLVTPRPSLDAVAAPMITGTAAYGQTLTAIAPAYSATPEVLDYQWLRDNVAIPGATGTSYALGVEDIAHSISVQVTPHLTGYVTATATSAAVAVAAQLIPVTAITVTGTHAYGHTLTAHAPTWTAAPTSVSYQWLRSGAPIKGATKPSYTLAVADIGRPVSVRITPHRAGYRETAATSAGRPVTKQIVNLKRPTIGGAASMGRVLTAKPGTWSTKATSYTVQWYRDGHVIKGATHVGYRLAVKDRGHRITVRVVAHRKGYIGGTATSAPRGVRR